MLTLPLLPKGQEALMCQRLIEIRQVHFKVTHEELWWPSERSHWDASTFSLRAPPLGEWPVP